MNKKLGIKLIVLALLAAVGTSAHAAKPVFDAANFKKNTIQAVQDVKQTAEMVVIRQNEIKQYFLQVQNLKKINPAIIQKGVVRGYIPDGIYSSPQEVANAAKGIYGTYGEIGSTMDGYQKSYEGIDAVMKDVNRVSIEAKVPAEKVLQHEFQRAQKGATQDDNYYNALQKMNSQLASHQRRSDALAESLPSQDGTVQLLQTLGAQNTVTQDQLSHLIQVNTITSAELVQNSKDDKIKREVAARETANGIKESGATSKYFETKKKSSNK